MDDYNSIAKLIQDSDKMYGWKCPHDAAKVPCTTAKKETSKILIKLIKECHPDKTGSDDEKVKILNGLRDSLPSPHCCTFRPQKVVQDRSTDKYNKNMKEVEDMEEELRRQCMEEDKESEEDEELKTSCSPARITVSSPCPITVVSKGRVTVSSDGPITVSSPCPITDVSKDRVTVSSDGPITVVSDRPADHQPVPTSTPLLVKPVQEEEKDTAPEEKKDTAPEEKKDTAPEGKKGTAPEEKKDTAPEEKKGRKRKDTALEEKKDTAPEEREEKKSTKRTKRKNNAQEEREETVEKNKPPYVPRKVVCRDQFIEITLNFYRNLAKKNKSVEESVTVLKNELTGNFKSAYNIRPDASFLVWLQFPKEYKSTRDERNNSRKFLAVCKYLRENFAEYEAAVTDHTAVSLRGPAE